MALRRLLRLRDLLEIVPYSKTQLYQHVKDGSFPKPVAASRRNNAWYEDEVQAWQDRLDAARAEKARAEEKRAQRGETAGV